MFPNKRIENYYQLCNQALDFSNFSWWIIDLEEDPNVFYCNQVMCKIFSLDQAIIQHSVNEPGPVSENYNDNNIAARKSSKPKQIFDGCYQLKKGVIDEYYSRFPYYNSTIGETLYFSSRAKVLLKDDLGNAQLLIGIIEPALTSADLYEQATIDSLTGLKNRREFDSQLSFLMNLAIRERHCISLIMWDIDEFKQYNDLLGHSAGDKCLIKIAQSISDACRRSSDIVCRYGGGKFAVITYGAAQDAFFLAESLRERVFAMDIPHPAKSKAPVTLSVGYCSIIPDADSTPKQLIECAETALNQAKSNGKNACAQFREPVGVAG
ncbi:MAG: GGDEF domain-containing protein [Leptolyngbya sp. SIO3F4]|nr:GGDEF domain-containing protein [Leptolyngbya sp. SIO3F4]